MDFLLPLAMASEVFQFLDYQTLAVVTRATHTVRRTYEPLALELVKHLVRVAAGRAGALRVRLHETSLFHNLWKPAAGVASRRVGHAHCVPCPVRPGAGQCLGTDWFCRRLGSFCGGAFPFRSFFIAISTIEA